MFKKLALLLSVLAISKFAFANTGSEGSAAGKAHEEEDTLRPMKSMVKAMTKVMSIMVIATEKKDQLLSNSFKFLNSSL